MRSRMVVLGLLALLAGCSGTVASPSPRATPTPSMTPPAPSPSPTKLATPVAGACPEPPADASPGVAPFLIGPGYAISLGDQGISSPPANLVALSDWNVAGPGGCVANILAFRFGRLDEAASFARTQGESVGLVPEDIEGATVWFSGSGDAARLAIGPIALSVTVDAVDPIVARDLVRSILEATPASS